MSESVLISELTWTEYDRRVRERSPVVLLPIGALEQHGPHLPMNCDTLIPAAISKAVAERIDGLVAPPIGYGYKSQPRSGGGNHFPGTTSLDGLTLTATMRDIVREFARHGVRRMAVMVGHYENTMFVAEGCDLALRELRVAAGSGLKIVHVGYWEFTSDDTIAQAFPDGFPGWPLEHAGVMETSVMLHLYPELVRMDQVPTHPPVAFPPYDVYPFDPASGTTSGALSSAKTASREKGALMFNEYVRGISAALTDEFGLAQRKPGGAAHAMP